MNEKKFPIQIVAEKIETELLRELADESYERLVKFVADIGQGIIAVGGEMYADAEALLLERGSQQKDLWGANIYIFEKNPAKRIEFLSLINIRPRDNNRGMEIESPELRDQVQSLAERLLLNSNESIN